MKNQFVVRNELSLPSMKIELAQHQNTFRLWCGIV